MGKVACKASTEIGHCAWRMIGRQSTNNSKSVIILFSELMVVMLKEAGAFHSAGQSKGG